MTSIAAMIRKTSADGLRQYFNQNWGLTAANIDWSLSEPTLVGPLLKAVDDMTDGEKARVELDAARVGGLADDAGQTAILSVVADTSPIHDLIGPHDRALWLFLNHPDLFRQAEEVRFTDERRRGRAWDGFVAAQFKVLNRSIEATEAFKKAVRQRFLSANVHIDIFERRRVIFNGASCDLIQIAVYREGLPDDVLEFDSGDLVRKVRNPVFEAALTYEPSTGVIEVVANDRASRADLATFIARDLLDIPIISEKLPLRHYDLAPLLTRHRFDTDLEDGIESVSVKQLRLMPIDNPGRRVTLECMRNCALDIWSMADDEFGPYNPLLGGWVATQAKMTITFNPKPGARRGRVLSLTVTMPHGCNLKDLTPEEQLIGEKYLRRWGILSGADLRHD